jgi:hypothetical protein
LLNFNRFGQLISARNLQLFGSIGYDSQGRLKAIEQPGNYSTPRFPLPIFPASSDDLTNYPIDDINPLIDRIAGDLRYGAVGTGMSVPSGSPAPPLGIGGNPYSVTTVKNVPTLKSETKYLIDRNVLNYQGIPDEKFVIQSEVTTQVGTGVVYAQAVSTSSTLVTTLPPFAETETLIGLPGLVAEGVKDLVLVGKDALAGLPEVVGGVAAETAIAAGVLAIVLAWAAVEAATARVNITISTFPEGEGLGTKDNDFVKLPFSGPEGLLYRELNGDKDYNPNRVMTLTWNLIDQAANLGNWSLNGVDISSGILYKPNEIAINALNLTAGQTYYWQGEYISGTTPLRGKIDGGEFTVPQRPIDLYDEQEIAEAKREFSTVTIITPDRSNSVTDTASRARALELAKGIARNYDGDGDSAEHNGTILVFDPTSNSWYTPFANYSSLTNLQPNKYGAPLILIDDWGLSSTVQNGGFAEASADNFFAALVNLNQSYSGIYKDAIFNSPLHFIGHGRGAVVNSEVIQRLGIYFPNAGGIERDVTGKVTKGDLQMTTLDPEDFALFGNFDYREPQIQVWDNVTFADNYYQTTSLNHRGRELVNTIPDGWFPGSNIISRADVNVDLSTRSGFTAEDLANGKDPHNNTFAWYAGTADLSLKGEDSAFGTQILRRRGDFSQDVFNDGQNYAPWYTNDLKPVNPLSDELVSVPFGSVDGQWEGVGTGWYYSAIGGGRS